MDRYVNGLKSRYGCTGLEMTVNLGARLRHLDAFGSQTEGITHQQNTLIHGNGFAVVESRQLVRDCLSMYLASAYDIAVDGCETVDEYLATEEENHGLVIMGAGQQQRQIMLGQLSRLCRECGSCPVIVMMDGCDYGLVSDSLRSGARGIVPTSLSMEIAREAIGLVLAGGTYIPAEGMMTAQPKTEGISCTMNLTAREEQVLALLKAGKQNKQIAYCLGLSEGTVKVHLHNMMKKLGTSNRTQTILATTS